MAVAKLMKNGSINLPSEIKKKLNIKSGDKISFIDTEHGVVIVPIVDIFNLVNSDNLIKTIEIIDEIRDERKKLAKDDKL